MRKELLEARVLPLEECVTGVDLDWQCIQPFIQKMPSAQLPLLKAAHLDKKAEELISIIASNTYANPPRLKRLAGEFSILSLGGLISNIGLFIRFMKRKKLLRSFQCCSITNKRTPLRGLLSCFSSTYFKFDRTKIMSCFLGKRSIP